MNKIDNTNIYAKAKKLTFKKIYFWYKIVDNKYMEFEIYIFCMRLPLYYK